MYISLSFFSTLYLPAFGQFRVLSFILISRWIVGRQGVAVTMFIVSSKNASRSKIGWFRSGCKSLLFLYRSECSECSNCKIGILLSTLP